MLVVKGRANQDLSSVFSFVPDDAFGMASLTSARRFEILLPDGHEANSVLSGLPLLLSVQPASPGALTRTAQLTLGARFIRFSGSTQLFIQSAVTPVYTPDPVNDLRYRGEVSVPVDTTALEVSTSGGSDPAVSRADADTFRFAWEYESFADTASQDTLPVFFSALRASGLEEFKQAYVELRLTGLQITTGDPYEVWPTPSCEPSVFACVEAGGDISACGDYRAVKRCLNVDACSFEDPAPLSLTAFDAAGLAPAVSAFNAGCGTGGSWCGLNELRAYTLPECPEEPATIGAVVPLVFEGDQNAPQDLSFGSFLDRAGLAGTVFLQDGYSTAGTELLEALDAFAGSQSVEGWNYVEEVPCHNCSEFVNKTILLYPSAGQVFLLDGYFGYDS